MLPAPILLVSGACFARLIAMSIPLAEKAPISGALTPGQHLALGKRFGDIQEQGYAGTLAGHPGVWVQEYPAWRQFLESFTAIHDTVRKNFHRIFDSMGGEITGLSERESRAVLDFLFAHQTRPEFQWRWHWEPKSLALWDNYSTIHRGIFAFGQGHRLMHRVSFHDHWRPA